MAGHVRIMIRASGTHPDILTIRDAFDQVRDIFELAGDDTTNFAWKLVSASTNTPLTITAEMVAMEPDVSAGDLETLANQRTQELHAGFAALDRGTVFQAWAEGPKAAILKRVLKRSLNGIGRTDLQINDYPGRETLTPQKAEAALRALEFAVPAIDRSRAEVGSIEGEYRDIGHHYGHPAIKLRERKTGAEIWCWVSGHDLDRFSERVRAADVWLHKRVRARGKIHYKSNGDVLHIEARDIQLVDVPRVAVDDVHDAGFTSGLRVSEYLDRIRDGTFG